MILKNKINRMHYDIVLLLLIVGSASETGKRKSVTIALRLPTSFYLIPLALLVYEAILSKVY